MPFFSLYILTSILTGVFVTNCAMFILILLILISLFVVSFVANSLYDESLFLFGYIAKTIF